MTTDTARNPVTHYTDSPDGTRIIPPAEHSPDVVAWLVGEKYPSLELRTVQCSVEGCVRTTSTATPPEADVVVACSREHMAERDLSVQKCVCARAAVRMNAPSKFPPVCSEECAEMRMKRFGV